MKRWTRWCAAGLFLALLTGLGTGCGNSPSPVSQPEHPLTVAAAASVQPVVEALAGRMNGGIRNEEGMVTYYQVTTTFGATKQLAQQVAAGAPIDLFLAADTESVTKLAAAGHIISASIKVYAYGSVVLWLKDTPAQPGLAALDDARVRKIGIANPELAPYGAAVRLLLRNANRWNALQARLVFGENVGQVAAYAARGEVDAAFLPKSLARERNLAVQELPGAPRLAHALGVAARMRPDRQLTVDFFIWQLAHELQRYGYDLP